MLPENFRCLSSDRICRMMYVVFGDAIVVVGFEVEVFKNDERQE